MNRDPADDQTPLLESNTEDSGPQDGSEQEIEQTWNTKLHHLKMISWYRRPGLVFINMACFLYTLTSIGEPTRQIVRFKYACNSLIHDGYCDSIDTQFLVSDYNQVSLIVSQICLLVAISNIGKLSDKFGRRLFINLIVCLVLISRVILLFWYQKSQLFEFKWYILCDFIASSMGGLYGIVGLANSYVADVVIPNQRSYALGYIMGSMFAGETLGPLLSKFLSNRLSQYDSVSDENRHTYSELAFLELTILRLEVLIFAGLMLYTLFLLPESTILNNQTFESQLNVELEQDNHQTKQHSQVWNAIRILNPIKVFNLLAPLKLLLVPKELIRPQLVSDTNRIRFLIGFLVFLNVLLSIYLSGVAQIIIQYAVYKYDWEAHRLADLMAMSSLSNVVVLYGVSPFISGIVIRKILQVRTSKLKIDNSDYILLFFGLCFNTILYLGISLSNTTLQYLTAIVVGNMGSVLQPTIQSIVLKYYPESKTAEVLMALSLNYGIGSIIAPLFAVNLFKLGLTHGLPQLVFLVCCGINMVVVIGLIVVKRLIVKHSHL